MPVLAIVGRRDIVFSARTTGRQLEGCVSKVKVICLPDAGHGLTDQTRTIADFLGTYASRNSSAMLMQA
jgi:hypothetical protein